LNLGTKQVAQQQIALQFRMRILPPNDDGTQTKASGDGSRLPRLIRLCRSTV
jgi:hypothetical protein